MIVKLKLIDSSELIFPAQYIQNLIEEDWMLSNYIDDCKSNDNIDTFEISETKEVVLSIIQTLKIKKICLNSGLDINYFEYIADAWCLPSWVHTLIEEYKLDMVKKEKNILSLSKKDEFLNNVTVHCTKCRGGYKLCENTSTSCKSHPGYFVNGSYNCCGQNAGSPSCTESYHVPMISHLSEIIKMAEKLD